MAIPELDFLEPDRPRAHRLGTLNYLAILRAREADLGGDRCLGLWTYYSRPADPELAAELGIAVELGE